MHARCELVEAFELLEEHDGGGRDVEAVLFAYLVEIVDGRYLLEYVVGRVVDELIATDAAARLARLRLQLDELLPHVARRLGVVADLGVGVQAEHLRRVGQWQRVDVLFLGV